MREAFEFNKAPTIEEATLTLRVKLSNGKVILTELITPPNEITFETDVEREDYSWTNRATLPEVSSTTIAIKMMWYGDPQTIKQTVTTKDSHGTDQ